MAPGVVLWRVVSLLSLAAAGSVSRRGLLAEAAAAACCPCAAEDAGNNAADDHHRLLANTSLLANKTSAHDDGRTNASSNASGIVVHDDAHDDAYCPCEDHVDDVEHDAADVHGEDEHGEEHHFDATYGTCHHACHDCESRACSRFWLRERSAGKFGPRETGEQEKAYTQGWIAICLILVTLAFEHALHRAKHAAHGRRTQGGWLAHVTLEHEDHFAPPKEPSTPEEFVDARCHGIATAHFSTRLIDRASSELMILGFLALVIFVLHKVDAFDAAALGRSGRWGPQTHGQAYGIVETSHISLFCGMLIYFCALGIILTIAYRHADDHLYFEQLLAVGRHEGQKHPNTKRIKAKLDKVLAAAHDHRRSSSLFSSHGPQTAHPTGAEEEDDDDDEKPPLNPPSHDIHIDMMGAGDGTINTTAEEEEEEEEAKTTKKETPGRLEEEEAATATRRTASMSRSQCRDLEAYQMVRRGFIAICRNRFIPRYCPSLPVSGDVGAFNDDFHFALYERVYLDAVVSELIEVRSSTWLVVILLLFVHTALARSQALGPWIRVLPLAMCIGMIMGLSALTSHFVASFERRARRHFESERLGQGGHFDRALGELYADQYYSSSSRSLTNRTIEDWLMRSFQAILLMTMYFVGVEVVADESWETHSTETRGFLELNWCVTVLAVVVPILTLPTTLINANLALRIPPFINHADCEIIERICIHVGARAMHADDAAVDISRATDALLRSQTHMLHALHKKTETLLGKDHAPDRRHFLYRPPRHEIDRLFLNNKTTRPPDRPSTSTADHLDLLEMIRSLGAHGAQKNGDDTTIPEGEPLIPTTTTTTMTQGDGSSRPSDAAPSTAPSPRLIDVALSNNAKYDQVPSDSDTDFDDNGGDVTPSREEV